MSAIQYLTPSPFQITQTDIIYIILTVISFAVATTGCDTVTKNLKQNKLQMSTKTGNSRLQAFSKTRLHWILITILIEGEAWYQILEMI